MGRGSLVINAATRPLYPQGRRPNYIEFGGPHGRSGRIWKISTSPEFELRTVQAVASRHTGRPLLYVSPSSDIQKQRLLPTARSYEFWVDLGTNCGYLYCTNLLILTARYAESINISRVKLSFLGVKTEVILHCEFIKPVLYRRIIHILLFSPALFRYWFQRVCLVYRS
jgi:hypothetical protein